MSFSAHKHHHLEAMACEYEETESARASDRHPRASSRVLPFLLRHDRHGQQRLSRPRRHFLKNRYGSPPSTTWGDKFMVPADAEVIIEGEILPGVRQSQNPFGEILGYAQPVMDVPVIEVTAITHRRGGIVEDFWPGHMDHWNLGSIPKEGSTYNVIKKNIPGIKGIHLAASGCGRCICYISIKKEFENEPNKAGMQAFVEMPNLKLAVIVDEDIDVFNEREVMWAVATRVHWDKDIEIIREVQSFRGWLGDTVAIIDATIPLEIEGRLAGAQRGRARSVRTGREIFQIRGSENGGQDQVYLQSDVNDLPESKKFLAGEESGIRRKRVRQESFHGKGAARVDR